LNKFALFMSCLLLGNSLTTVNSVAFSTSTKEPVLAETETVTTSQLEELAKNEQSNSTEETSAATQTNSSENQEVSTETTTTFSASEENQPQDKRSVVYESELQDSDGYWLVGDLDTLKTYIVTDKKTELRLTADIDIGSTNLTLYDGFVLDGAGHTLSYNKGASTTNGFHLNESDATITLKNLNIGTPDGQGATGYYGIVNGYDSYTNMTMIFENIHYKTSNGQPFYNVNGRIILKGDNTFEQTGSSTYSQEWAETNYIEIASGTTKVVHNTGVNYGFIYAHGTSSSNPYASSVNLIVRSGATFDVETGHAFFYSAASYDHSIIVEDQASFMVKQSGTDAIRKRFIYPDLSTSAATNFQFGDNSNSKLDFQVPLSLNNSRGGMSIGTNATFEMNVANGQMFSLGSSGTFNLDLQNVKNADFTGTTADTLGLRASAGVGNLSFRGTNRMKVRTYDDPSASLPSASFNKKETSLNVLNGTYQNVSGDPLSQVALDFLGSSKRLVFTNVLVPDILTTAAVNTSSQEADLTVTVENHGLPITQIKYFLYTNEADIGLVEKAKHIYTDHQPIQNDSAYHYKVTDLNPNTRYWLQAVVSNENSSGEWGTPILFATDPVLQSLTIKENEITETTATITGIFANNTGFWTDYSKGEEEAVGGQVADYGVGYADASIQLEYSRDPDFSEVKSVAVTNRFGENDSQFSVELTALRPDSTYHARVKVTGISGKEVLSPLVCEFKTNYAEVIDVSIPVDMLFETDNTQASTTNAGAIQTKAGAYEIKNQGNVATSVTVTDFTAKNAEATNIELLSDLNGQNNANQLALKLLAKGRMTTEIFLTPDLRTNPALLGTLDTAQATSLQLDFGGKYYRPLGEVVQPAYTMTLKFEKAE
jgi:hypothetical protein